MHWRKRIPMEGVIAADRPWQRSLTLASVFAFNAAVSCAILFTAYHFMRGGASVGWAIVSAILVMIPDLKQTVSTALARVAANIVGALSGLIVVKLLGEGPLQVTGAVVLVSYVCHLLRLDLGLRTACVSVVIVMLTHPHEIEVTSLERFVAVVVGCGVGVACQLTALSVQKRLARGSTQTLEE